MRQTWGVILLGLSVLAWAPGLNADDKKDEKGTVVEVAGFKAKVPADWKSVELTEAQKNFGRLYQFDVPKAKDDKYGAVMTITRLAGEAGGATANVDRWKLQFTAPEKGKVESKSDEMKVGDTKVTYADIEGSYKYKKNPFDANEKEELRTNYRLIGVVFPSKEDTYFIRFLGSTKTIEANKKAFDEWLKGLK
jgi:hypothetical protein